jgi:hypothetical protein
MQPNESSSSQDIISTDSNAEEPTTTTINLEWPEELNLQIPEDTFDAISNQLIGLSSSLDQHGQAVKDAIHATSNTPWTSIVLGAVLGALSAFLFNLLNLAIVRRRNKRESLAKGIIETIILLEDEAIGYWLQSAAEMSAVDRRKSEIMIKAKFKSIPSQTRKLYAAMFKTKKNKIIIHKCLTALESLYDEATGGDFETNDRRASSSKASKITTICNELISTLTDAL